MRKRTVEGEACSTCRHRSAVSDYDGTLLNYCDLHNSCSLPDGDIDEMVCDDFEPSWPIEVGL